MNIQETITIASGPFDLPPNFAKYCIIQNGAGVINLPNPLQGLSPIIFSNVSSTTPVLLNYNNITVQTLQLNDYVVLFPYTSGDPPGTWLPIISNYVPITQEAWTVNGNTLDSTGMIGSVNNQNVNLVRGTITMLSLLSGAVTLQTNFNCNNNPLINCPNPINSQDVVNKGYTDNKYTNLIGSVVHSVATGDQTITLTQGINNTYCVLFNVYGTNFTQWYSQNCIVRPGVSPDGYNYFTGNASATATAILVIKAPTSIGGTSFTSNVTLNSGATGYDIYIYN